jgi:hypothetical protein
MKDAACPTSRALVANVGLAVSIQSIILDAMQCCRVEDTVVLRRG